MDGLLEQADSIGFDMRSLNLNEDLTGLYGLVLFGLKGLAAYTDHAKCLDTRILKSMQRFMIVWHFWQANLMMLMPIWNGH